MIESLFHSAFFWPPRPVFWVANSTLFLKYLLMHTLALLNGLTSVIPARLTNLVLALLIFLTGLIVLLALRASLNPSRYANILRSLAFCLSKLSLLVFVAFFLLCFVRYSCDLAPEEKRTLERVEVLFVLRVFLLLRRAIFFLSHLT